MSVFKDKIYTFSVMNDDGTDRVEIVRTSNWEGLQPWQQLNMLKLLLLEESWSEKIVKTIRILEQDMFEELYPEGIDVLEEYR
jgi:hypothetical protein